MKKTVLSFLVICIAITTMQAQNEPVNPFEEFGYKPKIATLSKGKYVEFYDQDTIVQIGGAVFNTVTMKIMGFVEYDTIRNEYNISPEVISRWLSPDPLTSEFPSWSPYNFVENNPIRLIDPTGLAPNDYTVDDKGNVELTKKTDDNFDVLYNEDKSKSIKVDKGVLSSSRTNTVMGSNDKEYTFDQYDVTGDDKAKGLFEFVANNTNVEWSLTGVGAKSGAKGKSILTTSHIKDSEIGSGYLLGYGYTIRSSVHSHPYHPYPSLADKNFAKLLNLKFPKATLDIYHKGEYFQFNKNGLIEIPLIEINLPEIEIEAPKND